MLQQQKPLVRFDWIIHYACNYRCSYCFYYEGSGWEILQPRNAYLSPSQWMQHWQRIYDRYGRCYIGITGGEPFSYPHFIELISKLSELHYPLNISTNSSGNLETFVDKVPAERVSLSVSFHPQFDQLDTVLQRVQFLRKNQFAGCINFLAYPPHLNKLAYYKNRFAVIGEELKIIPFRGIYKEIAYPAGYTKEQKSLIGLKEEWFDKVGKRGNLCYAGKQSALLLPEGDVSRCGQLWYNNIIGNFFDRDFQLLKEGKTCTVKMCPCNEDILWGEQAYANS